VDVEPWLNRNQLVAWPRRLFYARHRRPDRRLFRDTRTPRPCVTASGVTPRPSRS